MRARVGWTTKEERALVYEEAVSLLEHMGMRFGPGRALETLANAGAAVDRETGTARIPRRLVECALATMPHSYVLGGATPDRDCVLDGSIHFLNSGQASRTIDFETGAYRSTTVEDLRKATTVLDSMSAVDIIWPIVAGNDCPPQGRIVVEIAATLASTGKHVQVQIEDLSQVDPILRMTEVVGGDLESRRHRPRVSFITTTASPMQAHGPALDACIEMAVHGFPVNILSMPTTGGTAPITVAGAVVMNIAEFLGAATAVQLSCPGAPLMMGACAGVLDMRTTTFAFAALEAGQISAACVEVSHYLGVPALAPALATDAKYAGVQAGFEKALKGLVVASSGADLMTGGIGLLNGAGVLSLPQIIIDNEIAQMIKRILGEVEITPETIMADMIERVGFSGDYLREKETRRRVRAGEQFLPSIASRLSYEKWQEVGRTEYDVACERVREVLALADERGPLLSADQVRELDVITAAVSV